jgi:hypothetical protein
MVLARENKGIFFSINSLTPALTDSTQILFAEETTGRVGGSGKK